MMTMLHTWVSNNEFGALLRLDTRFLQCWEKSCHKWNTQILVFHSIKDAMVFSKISKKRVQKLLKLLPNMQSGKNTVNGCSRESLWSANFAFSHDYDIFFYLLFIAFRLKMFWEWKFKASVCKHFGFAAWGSVWTLLWRVMIHACKPLYLPIEASKAHNARSQGTHFHQWNKNLSILF